MTAMAESLIVSGLRERPLRSVTCRLMFDSATGSSGSRAPVRRIEKLPFEAVGG